MDIQQLIEKMLDIQMKSISALRELENKMIQYGYLDKSAAPRGLSQMVNDLKKAGARALEQEEEECKFSDDIVDVS